jgi:hypothetical protein
MTGFPESKLAWLSDKFGKYEGWFNASDIRHKGDKKYKNDDWKNLMGLAVERGYVYSWDSYPSAPKDSIAFNLPKTPEFFDNDILNDPYLRDMPELVFDSMGWDTTDSREFFVESFKWTTAYELLCGLQYRGFIDKQLLDKYQYLYELNNENSSEGLRIFHIDHAKEICSIYKLVKFGWTELVQTGYVKSEKSIYQLNYNEVFLRIIWDRCKRSVLAKRNNKPSDLSNLTKLRLAQEYEYPSDEDIDILREEKLKRMDKLWGLEEKYNTPDLHHLTLSASCYHIKEILKDSPSPMVIEALTELASIVTERKKAYIKNLRKKVDKRLPNNN